MKNVVLISRKTQNVNLLQLHKGIAKAIKGQKYDWKVVRVSEDGQADYQKIKKGLEELFSSC